MKFTWKIEEMALMAEKANEYGKKIYKAEKELSREIVFFIVQYIV